MAVSRHERLQESRGMLESQSERAYIEEYVDRVRQMACGGSMIYRVTIAVSLVLIALNAHAQVLPAQSTDRTQHPPLITVPLTQATADNSTNAVVLAEPGPGPRKPAIALALSILVPGAGQVYNGQIAKGVVFASLFYGGVVMITLADITRSHKSITGFGWMCVMTVAGTHVWNMVDAASTAQRLSDEAAQHSHAFETTVGTHALAFDAAVVPRAAGVRIEFGL